MIIVRSLAEIQRNPASVVTVGTFDGVHVAHQKIIGEVVKKARRSGSRSVILTFDPHPRHVLFHTVRSNQAHEEYAFGVLTPMKEKLCIFEAMGVDCVFIIPFTKEFAGTSFRDFYRSYIVDGIGVAEVVEGYDHSFGKNREAGLQQLRDLGEEFGFTVDVEEPVSVNGTVVSSSRIRTALYAGDVAGAAKMLGRPYVIGGIVQRGDQRGRSLGFPTANIEIDDQDKLLPANGVYAARTTIGGVSHGALLSIGVLPTFFDVHVRQCEVHVFDFDGDLYGATLTIECVGRIRDERKFASVPELIKEMEKDSYKGKILLSQSHLS
ncbi:MAG: riboflavin biosynthesis protein RibF [Ignavibacteriales bacterium]|nr:riboflavin biosynthesis protein RibF [Ignavibacteriales bacterium]